MTGDFCEDLKGDDDFSSEAHGIIFGVGELWFAGDCEDAEVTEIMPGGDQSTGTSFIQHLNILVLQLRRKSSLIGLPLLTRTPTHS